MHRATVRSGWRRSREPGVHRRAEFYYQQLDALRSLRQQVRRELLGGEPETSGVEAALSDSFDGSDPGGGVDRHRTDTAPLPHQAAAVDLQRFWHRDAQQRRLSLVSKDSYEGAKKPVSIRGLNTNLNHDLKNLFKGAAIVAANKPGPFQEFYAALLAKGIRPEMARLTLARKIAAITLHRLEERSAFRRPISETTSSLSVSDRVRSILGIFSGGGRRVLETLGFESESQLIS